MSIAAIVVLEYRTHEIQTILAAKGYISLKDNQYDDYELIKGWVNSLDKLHIQADVAFIGNSITNNSDFQGYFKDKKVVTLGVSGFYVSVFHYNP